MCAPLLADDKDGANGAASGAQQLPSAAEALDKLYGILKEVDLEVRVQRCPNCC